MSRQTSELIDFKDFEEIELEAAKENFETLVKNTKNIPNVISINKAIWNKNSKLKIVPSANRKIIVSELIDNKLVTTTFIAVKFVSSNEKKMTFTELANRLKLKPIKDKK